MSIPDYRTFFRCCAAFLLAGVLAAGHAAAQQEGAPAAVPEQVQELAPEQPQAEPDHSEMDTVIMALCHEITILKKNEEKRMAIREALVKEADATYNYFDTRVYEMSAVLYALDDQKIFTLAFYCKAASSLVKTYYAQRPDFQGQEERLDKEIGRIKKLAESLEEVNTDNLSEPSLVQRDEALYTCRTLEESLLKEKEQISYLKELFNSLGGKIDALNHESGKLFTSLFNRVFYTPSNAARYIFLKPLKTYEICMGPGKRPQTASSSSRRTRKRSSTTGSSCWASSCAPTAFPASSSSWASRKRWKRRATTTSATPSPTSPPSSS